MREIVHWGILRRRRARNILRWSTLLLHGVCWRLTLGIHGTAAAPATMTACTLDAPTELATIGARRNLLVLLYYVRTGPTYLYT